MKIAPSRLRIASFWFLPLAGTVALLISPAAKSLQSPPLPAPLRVDASVTGTHDGLTWATAYNSLDAAISAALPQGELWVVAGTYTPTGASGFLITKQLKLYGGFAGTEPDLQSRTGLFLSTILDGNLSSPVVSILAVTGGPGVLIDGFQITNGIANSLLSGTTSDGGGIYAHCSDLALANCFIKNNFAAFDGGGVFFEGGCPTPPSGVLNTLTVKLCEFRENHTEHDGGALFGSALKGQIANTSFLLNYVYQDGGAVYLWQMSQASADALVFTNCVFQDNHADNTTPKGGAMCLGTSTLTPPAANANTVNCTFAVNYLTNSCNNGQAVDVSSSSSCAIINSILYFNYQGCSAPTTLAVAGSPTFDYSDVEYWSFPLVTTNITGAPLFRSLALGGLTLKVGSPCMDSAFYTALGPDVLDVDEDGDFTEIMPIELNGSDRYFDYPGVANLGAPNTAPALDMGAYEKR